MIDVLLGNYKDIVLMSTHADVSSCMVCLVGRVFVSFGIIQDSFKVVWPECSRMGQGAVCAI